MNVSLFSIRKDHNISSLTLYTVHHTHLLRRLFQNCSSHQFPSFIRRIHCTESSEKMVDTSKPKMSTIYLYVPNIIGYIRVLMNCRLCNMLFSQRHFRSSIFCELLSTLGAVLDMVTDRISTACLLVLLSQIYRPGLIFLSLLALDIVGHWFQMYCTFLSGKASHKDVKDSSSWLFRAYYGNRMFMAFCCVSCEVLYILLFLLANSQSEDVIDVVVSSARQSLPVYILEALVLFGWVVKQSINVIQLKTAADMCVLYDINTKQKP